VTVSDIFMTRLGRYRGSAAAACAVGCSSGSRSALTAPPAAEAGAEPGTRIRAKKEFARLTWENHARASGQMPGSAS
jgi:hypothetical protein